jgi:hypothetical protein
MADSEDRPQIASGEKKRKVDIPGLDGETIDGEELVQIIFIE